MTWTAAKIEKCQQMWEAGYSASQIANVLAGGMTRNAVIGKMTRLGVNQGAKRLDKPPLVAADAPLPAPPPKRPKPVSLAPKPAERPIREADVVIPLSQRVSLIELRASSCRWPIGDPRDPDGLRYCGGQRAIMDGAHSYCLPHSRIAYVPSQKRVRVR